MAGWGWKLQLQQTEAQLDEMRANRDARNQPTQQHRDDIAPAWMPVCHVCINEFGVSGAAAGIWCALTQLEFHARFG